MEEFKDLTPTERTLLQTRDREDALKLARSTVKEDPPLVLTQDYVERWYLAQALIALEAREKRLTEALRFYANEDNYWPSDGDDISDIQFDEGMRAREALEAT